MQKQKYFKPFISFILSFAVSTTVMFSPFSTNFQNKAYAATPDSISISENGLQFIIDMEGFSPVCFWDYAQWTIGYGTRCTETDHPENPDNLQKGSHSISESEARSRFLSALENTYIPGVRRKFAGLNMNQNQFDALVSLCYNAGEGKLANSPFMKYLKGEITKEQAYNDYCSYVITAGGKVNQGLINRRRLEADLFFSGIIIDDGEVKEGCFRKCSSSYTSIVEALKSIDVDSSMEYRKQIAAANEISDYSGTAEQNIQMLNMLKAGTLKVPNGEEPVVPVEPPVIDNYTGYFPKCSSGFLSIVDALKSIGVDSSMSNRKVIAAANGISDYSSTASQNTQMLDLLKAGQLIDPSYVAPQVYTVTLNANGGYTPVDSLLVASNGTYKGLPSASREGYTFNGWFTSIDSGSQVTDGNGLVSASDHTLYAHWTKLPENESLKLSETQITMINGGQYSIIANQEDLTYESNDTDVVIVSKSGLVTAVGTGSAIVSVINKDYDVVQLKIDVVSTASSVSGDCDGNGSVEIADAVMLQKWLLGSLEELTYWQNVDLCEDGKIDVFDMIQLRKLIIENQITLNMHNREYIMEEES